MKRRQPWLLPTLGLSLALLAPGCTSPGVSGSPGSTGKVSLVMDAVNFRQAALSQQAAYRISSATAINTNNTAADSILSTAPEEMVVYLQSISGSRPGQADVPFWTSPSPGGTPITLQSGNADLSAIGGAQLAALAGAYTGVTLQFARVGQIKGSVKGTFKMDTTAGTGPFSGSPAPGAANQYTNEAVRRGQTETFCTRADKSELNAETFSTTLIGSNADFDPAQNRKTDSELVDIDLDLSNDQNLTVAQIRQASLKVTSQGNFTVTPAAPTTLTLAVDLNRMLRFYANTRSDHQPPNPGMKAGTSYFFTTVFPSSITAFGGPIGSVQGYQLTANSVAAWMTVFLDASGNVIAASVMPDDDNDLTIMKGAATGVTGQLTSGLGMNLAVSNSTLSGFKGLSMNATGSAALTINQTSGNGIPAGTQFGVSYQRLL